MEENEQAQQEEAQVEEDQSVDLAKQIEDKFKKELAGLNRKVSELSKEKEELLSATLTQEDRLKRKDEILAEKEAELDRKANELRLKEYAQEKAKELKAPPRVLRYVKGNSEEEIEESLKDEIKNYYEGFEEEFYRRFPGKKPDASEAGNFTYEELNAMSEAELKERGISGKDIEEAMKRSRSK